MKKAVILGERKAGLVDVPDPSPKDDWAVVKVHVTPMCTEYKTFAGADAAEFLGHEAVGEVVAVAQPGPVAVGDRVVVMPQYPCGTCWLCVQGDYIHCQDCANTAEFLGTREGTATYAQYFVKPSWILPKIPDGMSYERAGLALCALGPSFNAFDLMNVNAFDTVLITGLGPVGLGAVVNAAFRAARVIAVDAVAYRQQLAKDLGADAVLDPGETDLAARIRAMTDRDGVDKALDCSGAPAAHRLCIDAARRRGSVSFVGESHQETAISVSPDLIRKGLAVHGAWHYNLNLFPQVMRVIQQSPVIDRLATHTFPMSRVQEAFEVSASHECGKVLLKPWE